MQLPVFFKIQLISTSYDHRQSVYMRLSCVFCSCISVMVRHCAFFLLLNSAQTHLLYGHVSSHSLSQIYLVKCTERNNLVRGASIDIEPQSQALCVPNRMQSTRSHGCNAADMKNSFASKVNYCLGGQLSSLRRLREEIFSPA